MKILHLTSSYTPIGGVESYVRSVVHLLEQAGHQNAVICERSTPQDRQGAERVYPLALGDLRPQTSQAALEIIQREQPDAAYLHTVYNPALLRKVAQAQPTVAYIHAPYPVCPAQTKLFRVGDEICQRRYGLGCIPLIYLRRCSQARLPGNVRRIMRITRQYIQAYQAVRQILVGSQSMQALLVQNGFEAGRISLLAPHFERPHPLEFPTETPPKLLFIGRLEIEKGLPYLLEAVAEMKTECILMVAGEGSLRQKYEAQAQKLGLAGRVQFLGFQDEAQLRELFRQASLLAVPSIWQEMFGKVGIEALACGRPVVAFDVGGVSEWLIDGWNGALVKVKDYQGMARQMDELLADPARMRQLGANGLRFVEEHFAPEAHLARLLELFSAVIAR